VLDIHHFSTPFFNLLTNLGRQRANLPLYSTLSHNTPLYSLGGGIVLLAQKEKISFNVPHANSIPTPIDST